MAATAINKGARQMAAAGRLVGVVIGAMLLSLVAGAGAVSADDHRNATATFTKYISEWPEMAGIVGGDVGDGSYSGTVVAYEANDTIQVIDAVYRFRGSKHSFVANVHVVQTGLDAVITGLVVEGWGRGNQVRGQYHQTTCTLSGAPTDCFAGHLDILRGTKH